MKKAQGLSMNVIIIAAIALLVLVIISVLVLKAGGNLGDNTGCSGVGGTCAPDCRDLQPFDEWTVDVAHGGCDQGESCCIRLSGDNNG